MKKRITLADLRAAAARNRRRPGYRPVRPLVEVADERKPGEAFCADCPDHEACATAYPCSLVKRIDREAQQPHPSTDPDG